MVTLTCIYPAVILSPVSQMIDSRRIRINIFSAPCGRKKYDKTKALNYFRSPVHPCGDNDILGQPMD